MSKTYIIGNWKMNLNIHQASLYVHKLEEKIEVHKDIQVILAPSFLALPTLSLQVKKRQFKLAAQNVNANDEGAFTGEVAAPMLRGVAEYVLVGHSERRHIFGETNKDIRVKVQAVLRSGLTPILCVGETADERAQNEIQHVLHDQITGGLANVTSEEIEQIIIAYEPVWAIGTGKSATTEDFAQARDIIRHQIGSLYGKVTGKSVPILYGGSVNSSNAASYLGVKDSNGLLIGGASLKAEEFISITKQAHGIKEGVKHV